MSNHDQSKRESPDNSSQRSSQDDQQRKPSKQSHRYVNRIKGLHQAIYPEQLSTREERKIKQYVQRIEEKQRLEEAAAQKRKRPKVHQSPQEQVLVATKPIEPAEQPAQTLSPEKPAELEEISVPMQVMINPQQVVPKTEEQSQQSHSNLRLNPKLKMKEKHHIFLYLSDCYDRCADNVQKLNSTATQLYSPGTLLKSDQSSLFPINQDVYQETSVLTKNLKYHFQSSSDQVKQLTSPEQREFVAKYLDKRYLDGVLRESRLQIYKRNNNDKMSTNGKLIPKKQY